ncbi:tRNA (adenosine(37)-N6)-threonylcarbamoyltransferase complex transferase subunit TsaD [bacterium CG2_30_37_16]|nr:MAG: tRNA (adenosine(37)-N6)-threonylcarbamoyltransferase complex transferase subunit TsaD [bacterium CG2_30_37_16]PIX99031.1 MAG: tRNA (adenosine(37)-N6)-threonylcarbamoyltransferase complex transferase subunit TsaD [bacterium (Candidatus Howlettbacteria) CG_4_10_14_3_um_filter_37_10]PJB06070.1 MAG: tRNA (adenosine(37)-N6)-threonylcarbamoyltransferase complex transferase subunit TsaD [bacterium (Candidatus Howlettbacteria) CG_4_9_14_3_um_filter_37_10]
MNILSIETSCDETACAVVKNGREVLSNIIVSQIDIHKEYGGVVPEVAARSHIEVILPAIDKALKEAKIGWGSVDAIAVTTGPGLIGSLIIGVETAKTLAWSLKKPLISVNHLIGHIYANWIDRGIMDFPALCLAVSGGHTMLLEIKDYHNITKIGQTKDDAAGEAFDKVAKLLGLGYPGGPAITEIALKGDKLKFNLPRPMTSPLDKKNGNFNFSFSGLKTAVLSVTKEGIKRDEIPDLAASFQQAASDSLVTKVIWYLEKNKDIQTVMLAGGVAANTNLRETLRTDLEKLDFKGSFIYPEITYCTDNAAMIGAAAFYNQNFVDPLTLAAFPSGIDRL